MKQSVLLTSLIFSMLSANAQGLNNVQVMDQTASVTNVSNWASNNEDNSNVNMQQATNFNPNGNVYTVQVQSNNRGNRGGSAFNSFGNSGNNTNKTQANVKQTQQKTTNKPQVQTNVNNVVNGGIIENNLGNENGNRGRGGNILVNDININDNVQSNPVVNDTKKTVASKPVVKEYQGLDFKPSGLSGHDYSNGGKLKKGQKNFYTPHATKHKTVFKKKPSHKKVKHHTSKCAKW